MKQKKQAIIAAFREAGFDAYRDDEGVICVETQGYLLSVDTAGVYDIQAIGETEQNSAGSMTTLHFLPSDIRRKALDAAKSATGVVASITAAVEAADRNAR